MKRKILLNSEFFLFIFGFLFLQHEKAFSQLVIEWQKCLQVDNSQYSAGYSIAVTSDGGFITGGYAHVSTQQSNCFLIKTDSVGNKEWDNNYGGSSYDVVHSVIACTDGGYLFAGGTWSNDGDVTGFHGGQGDAWVGKTDANGNLMWQRAFGGSEHEYFYSVIQNQEGEFIAAGQTGSSDGDLAGLNAGGGAVMWIVKFDSAGTILDQKLIHNGCGLKIIQTSDKGYAVTGIGTGHYYTDFDTAYGLQDFGIAKLDSSLNIEWTKVYGGTHPEIAWGIIQTSDGSYVVSGGTLSNDVYVSGNHNGGGPFGDYWVIKLDSSGNFIWQRCLGGVTYESEKNSVVENGSGNYIIAGWFGDAFLPTDSIAIHRGFDDVWITALDTSGTLLWEKTLGGGGADGCRNLLKINDHEFILAGWTNSYDYDVSGYSGSNIDTWIVKIMDEPNAVTGNLFVDANSNLNHDSGEYVLPIKKVFETGTSRTAFSNSQGNYRLDLPVDGACTIKTDSVNYYNCVPALYNKTFTGFNHIDSLNDFAFQPVGTVNDLKIELTSITNLRNGFQTIYRLTFTNTGTAVQSGEIVFLKPVQLNYINSSVTPVTITADSIVWSYTNLNPYQTGNIDISILANNLVIGSLVQTTAKIYPISGDSLPLDNIAYNKQIVFGSYDPNEIAVNEDTLVLTTQPNPEYLEYVIRFQNLGNAPAIFVSVTNPVSDLLDMGTFELVAASHDVVVNYFQHSRNLQFLFDNINLPDSASNEPASHGLARYRVKPVNILTHGDSINNHAYIYFDYNPAVATNHVSTLVIECDSNLTILNPVTTACFGDTLTISASTLIPSAFSWYIDSVFYSNNSVINISNLPAGNHTIAILAAGNFGCNNSDTIYVVINPLPAVTLNAFISDTICISSGLQIINSGSPPGGVLSGTGVTGNTFDPVAAGTGWDQIAYEYTDLSGCTNIAFDSVFVDLCLNINSYQSSDGLRIYPNPAAGFINIECTNNVMPYSVILYDMPGKALLNFRINQKKNLIELTGLVPGNYFLKVFEKQNLIAVKRLVKLP